MKSVFKNKSLKKSRTDPTFGNFERAIAKRERQKCGRKKPRPQLKVIFMTGAWRSSIKWRGLKKSEAK